MRNPLVVDLDGTLLRTDMLLESMLCYGKRELYSVPKLLYWMIQGKASLKERLAKEVSIDVSQLPYNEDIVAFLKTEKLNNRHIVLATASHRLYAEKIAEHLGLFDQVIATEGDINMSSTVKRNRLIDVFGVKGFDYIGNSQDDISVLEVAEKAYLSDPEFGVEKKAKSAGNIEVVYRSRKNLSHSLIKALRPHQWMKNLLLFIPLLAAHQLTNIILIFHALLAFIFFSLSASSGYLFNDLLDLESDRHHASKKNRPLASGQLPILAGVIAAPLLFLAALAGSFLLLPPAFTIALVMYYILTLAYSQWLKQMMGVDTIVLAGLYTLRIIAGAYACWLVPTFWILAFSMFLFLSLAMVKRYAELHRARFAQGKEKIKGRGYFADDLEIIASLGSSAGYLSVLVLALYIEDARTMQLYHAHKLIWLSCPILLFWISRTWMLTHRGQMFDDPVLFAVKDKISLLTGALFAAVFILAGLM